MLCAAWLDVDDEGAEVYLCGATAEDFATGVLAQKALEASHLLYMASGRQFPGICSDTIRPCMGGAVQYLAYAGGGSRPINGCGCSMGRGCTAGGVVLPFQPAVEVTEVKVNGVVLGADQYRLVDSRVLMRVGGGWPCSQRLDLADTEDGTWSVTYDYGQLPDPAGLGAVGWLAVQLARACTDDMECDLPDRLQTITREGLTMTILDPFDFLEARRFGHTSTDWWLSQVNPASIDRPAKVLNVDLLGAHRS